MTATLTHEQIVTKILLSNEILNPIKNVSSKTTPENNLGKYLSNPNNESRYKFINEALWNI